MTGDMHRPNASVTEAVASAVTCIRLPGVMCLQCMCKHAVTACAGND